MIYVLLAITLLTLILIIILFWINNSNTNYMYSNVKRSREDEKAGQDKIDRLTRDFLKAIALINECQNNLDQKMSALGDFVDNRNQYVTFQQEQFRALVEADMLSARRSELILAKELKVALERLMSSAMVSRQPAASQDVLALENLAKRIDELENILKIV